MAINRTIVIKLSGAAFQNSDDTINTAYLMLFAQLIASLTRTWKVAVTVGGGKTARQYIIAAKKLGLPDTKASVIGSDIALINCRLTIAALLSAGVKTYSDPIESFSFAEEQLYSGLVPVLFNRGPALTSDSVAAYFADYVSANIVLKLSQIDAVYDHDPKSYPDAVPHNYLSYSELELISAQGDSRRAGASCVIDLLAAQRLKNSNIPLLLLHMSELELAVKIISNVQWEHATQGTFIRAVSI